MELLELHLRPWDEVQFRDALNRKLHHAKRNDGLMNDLNSISTTNLSCFRKLPTSHCLILGLILRIVAVNRLPHKSIHEPSTPSWSEQRGALYQGLLTEACDGRSARMNSSSPKASQLSRHQIELCNRFRPLVLCVRAQEDW